MKILKRYLPYLKTYKRNYIMILIGLTFSVIGTIGTAYIMKPMMDNIFIEKEKIMLLIVPLILIAIYSIKGIGRYIQSIYTEYIGLHMITRLRAELLKKIINLDMEFIYRNRNGELISRIVNDISQIRYFVANMIPELIRDMLTVIGLISYIIYLNPKLALFSLIVMPLVLYPLLNLAKKLKNIAFKTQGKDADIISKLNEIFNNYEMIKSNANENWELESFKNENWEFFKLQMKSVRKREMVSPILEIVGSLGIASVIYIGGSDVLNNKMSIGEFTAFITAVGLAFQPLKSIAGIYVKIQPSIAASERIFSVMDKENKIIEGRIILDNPINSIEFKNVGLDYDETPALKNINLKINNGENIGLIGNSGGGKSSLINLLLRFYDVSKGEILINNTNIIEFEQKSIREQISIVSQRIYIFRDTLAANISYGEEIDEEKIIKALKMADALTFVNNFKNGIYEIMEEFGMNLSGGQRQKISIARAIYKNSSILILDEATSALDNESERRIQENLKEFIKDKITITIAHRLSTIEDVDNILILEDGEIIDSGKHEDLMKISKTYQKMIGNSKF